MKFTCQADLLKGHLGRFSVLIKAHFNDFAIIWDFMLLLDLRCIMALYAHAGEAWPFLPAHPRFRRFCLQAKLKTLGMDVP